jgi:hypothetical protein
MKSSSTFILILFGLGLAGACKAPDTPLKNRDTPLTSPRQETKVSPYSPEFRPQPYAAPAVQQVQQPSVTQPSSAPYDDGGNALVATQLLDALDGISRAMMASAPGSGAVKMAEAPNFGGFVAGKASSAPAPAPISPVVKGTDACNDPANASFPGFPQFKIIRKDGYMTVELKSLRSSGFALTGTPVSRFDKHNSPDYQALFQSGFIYRGASQYDKKTFLLFRVSGSSMQAVVSWPDGSLKHVGVVEGYSTGTVLPKIVTVRFSGGACLVQYGDSGGMVSGGAGYLLVP